MSSEAFSNRSVKRAFGINSVFVFLHPLIVIIMTPLCYTWMGETVFGLWSLLWAEINFTLLFTFGLETTAQKFIANTNYEDKIIGNVLFFCFILIVLSGFVVSASNYLLAPFLSEQLVLNKDYVELFSSAIKVTSVTIFLNFLFVAMSGAMFGRMKYGVIRTIQLFLFSTSWIGAGVISFYSNNIRTLSLWLLFVFAISTIWMFIFLLREFRDAFAAIEVDKVFIKRISHFTFRIWILSLTNLSKFQAASKLIIGALFGEVIAGVYSIIGSLTLRISIFFAQLTQIFLPLSSYYKANERIEQFKSLYEKISSIFVIVVCFGLGILIIWRDLILGLIFNKDFVVQYSDSFLVMFLVTAFITIAQFDLLILTGFDDVNFSVVLYSIAVALTISSYYVIAKMGGGLFDVTVAHIAYASVFGIHFYLYRKFKIKIREYDILPFAILVGIILFELYLSPSILGKSIASLIVLFFVTWYLRRNLDIKELLVKP